MHRIFAASITVAFILHYGLPLPVEPVLLWNDSDPTARTEPTADAADAAVAAVKRNALLSAIERFQRRWREPPISRQRLDDCWERRWRVNWRRQVTLPD